MDHKYQQLDLQALIDLLAEETQQYTKAYVSGNLEETALRRSIIDALVIEVNSRKKADFKQRNPGLESTTNDSLETSS